MVNTAKKLQAWRCGASCQWFISMKHMDNGKDNPNPTLLQWTCAPGEAADHNKYPRMTCKQPVLAARSSVNTQEVHGEEL